MVDNCMIRTEKLSVKLSRLEEDLRVHLTCIIPEKCQLGNPLNQVSSGSSQPLVPQGTSMYLEPMCNIADHERARLVYYQKYK